MSKEYLYSLALNWTGNTGQGTEKYQSYERAYTLNVPGKPVIVGSADPAFRGDKTCWNPEELLLASIAACHMLWYLHLCSEAHIVVFAYEDHPTGKMQVEGAGAGRFQEVTLNPVIQISDIKQSELALSLHKTAHQKCFIANSLNFPVWLNPNIAGKFKT